MPAAAIVGGSVLSGLLGRRASNQQANAANSAADDSRRQFDLQRADQAPYIQTGQRALSQLGSLYGLNEGGGAPDMTQFTASPDYQFRQQEGQNAINRSLAARGKALSGQGVKEGQRYASGLASQEFGSYFDRLASLAGIGQTGAAQSAAAGAQSAGQVGQAQIYGGAARASGYANLNNSIQGGLQNYLLMQQMNQQQPDVWGRNSGVLANNYTGPKFGGYS